MDRNPALGDPTSTVSLSHNMTGILKRLIKPSWDGNTILHRLPSEFVIFVKVIEDKHNAEHEEKNDNAL